VDCQSLDPVDPRKVLQGMDLLKGRAAVCLQLSLPLLPDLDGNEFIMSQLLSLEEFPFGRRFWCLGWVWPQMTSTFTLSPKPTANR
jgi:hypothetical protein